jgi:hypothetical protein
MVSEPLGNDDFPCPDCGTMVRQFHHAHYPWAGGSVGVYMGHCEVCRETYTVYYGPREGTEHYAGEFAKFAAPHWRVRHHEA